MKKQYFDTLTLGYTVLIVAYGITLWAMADKNASMVTLNFLSRDVPDFNAFQTSFSELGVAKPELMTLAHRQNMSVLTMARLVDFCVFPNLAYFHQFTLPNSTSGTVLNQFLSTKDYADFNAKWNQIDFKAWFVNPSPELLPLNLMSRKGPKHLLPWCICVNSVIDKFVNDTSKKYEDANTAFKGCIATQHNVPRQKVAWPDSVDKEEITSRKTISRYHMLFIVCVAYLINTLYNRIDFSSDGDMMINNILRVSALVLAICLWILPIAKVPSAMIMTFMSTSTIMFVPGFVSHLALTELVWMWILTPDRRTSFIHPFVFYVTLLALTFLALCENGVFTLEIFINHYFLCNVVAWLYTAVMFFMHFRCGNWTEDTKSDNPVAAAGSHNITAYFIVCITVALIYVFTMVPTYPYSTEPNILWILPILFVTVAFGGAVWVEHLYDGAEVSDGKKLSFTSHLINMGHVLVVMVVLIYFTGQAMTMSYGDTFLAKGGLMPNRAEFSLSVPNPSLSPEFLLLP